MNNTTRKYPRTMNEAFGPYAYLDTTEKKMDWQDKLVMWGCAVAAVALMVVLWTS